MGEEKLREKLQEDNDGKVEVKSGGGGGNETDNKQEDAQSMDVEKELENARAEVEDLRDKMLRAAAENENFKKRVERERLASLKYAGEHIFRELLPVVDNLERALEQGSVAGGDAEKQLAALLEGVELTYKSLVSILAKFEVKVSESVGKPFDPKDQEAMTMAPSEAVPANHVISEFEKGYYYKDRLLRAAKVVVSSGDNGGNKD